MLHYLRNENKGADQLCSADLRLCFRICKMQVFIAPAYSRVRYRSPNFCPSVRSFVRSSVRSFVRPSTFTSKFGFLDIRDSCESETLHSNCP